MHDILEQAQTLRNNKQPFALATVVRVSRPASARPGSKAIVLADGTIQGWVGGSCAQPSVAREGVAALHDSKPRLLCLVGEDNKQPDRGEGVVVRPMTCHSGGSIEVYIEPFIPRPQLVLFGEAGVVRALSAIGQALNFEAIVVSPDADTDFGAAQRIRDFGEIAPLISSNSYIVIASHGAYDELALEMALASPAHYIAMVASHRRAEVMLSDLRRDGYSSEQLARLRAPAGLDIGASEPAEIALSIMAEIVQLRHRKPPIIESSSNTASIPIDPAPVQKPVLEPIALSPRMEIPLQAQTPRGETALDLVCQMQVEIANARWVHEYQGQNYYFCCPGCRRTFQREPEKYLPVATNP
jgi:xanthine dehydrogenase accessory factor